MDEQIGNTAAYVTQLKQVEEALVSCPDGPDKDNLLSLQQDLKQLIQLTQNAVPSSSENNPDNNQIEDEFALFMAEMEKEGVTAEKTSNIDQELSMLEGMKCRAPHKHQWGDTVYHNALVCSVVTDKYAKFDEIEVKVLFTNPTHQEMLPCPYYLDTDCKFSEEQCRYSHGEVVPLSALQEYIEPNFESLSIGSVVLVKQQNKLWHRAKVKRMYGEKCLVRFDSNKKDAEIELKDVLPLEATDEGEEVSSSDDEAEDNEDVINTSLLNTVNSDVLGGWEKHTKGIGSKLMQKMGYIVGSGLGRRSDGRIDPVTAVILPAGKSLDHCMHLRENAGGDKDLFSVERKLKRQQKRQELQNQRAYEREKKKVDVFNFLNETLSTKPENRTHTKKEHREEIRKESGRSLNVASLKIEEDIKRTEHDLYKLNESLTRHSDVKSQMNINLRNKLVLKQQELNSLQAKATNIKNEQAFRNDKRKLTIF